MRNESNEREEWNVSARLMVVTTPFNPFGSYNPYNPLILARNNPVTKNINN